MPTYVLPSVRSVRSSKKRQVQLIANGDLRLTANQKCWPEQAKMEEALTAARGRAGVRAGPRAPVQGGRGARLHRLAEGRDGGLPHGVDPDAPLIVAEAVWQYSHHVLHGLITPPRADPDRRQLVGHLAGAGGHAEPQRLADQGGRELLDALERGLHRRLLPRAPAPLAAARADAKHDTSHVTRLQEREGRPARSGKLGEALAEQLRRDKAIMGVFDEGCMGMFNAIIPDELLNPTGVFKERLSQSALYYETTQVERRRGARRAPVDGRARHASSSPGPTKTTDLTDEQILQQCKMYVAAVRIADDFGCDTIGIQYQQGLKDLLPASDLVEGTLNNADRPPVRARDGQRVLYAGEPLPHFNEVDECAGLDGLMTYRVHKAMGQPVENTLHDLRWGDVDRSGTVDGLRVGVPDLRLAPRRRTSSAAGPARRSERQPPMYFRLGGGTLKGISKPGEIVWSRDLRRRRRAEDGPRPGRRGRAAAGGDRSAAGTRRRRSGRSCTP